MERITVHEPMKGQLDALAQLAVSVDESGTPLGHFVPTTVASASDQCPYSPAELAQMHGEQGGRPLKEIWQHHDSLCSLQWFTTALFAVMLAAAATTHADEPALLDDYNVVWTSPSKDSTGSMPLGNGDLGVNAWVEPSGELVLLLGKTDAWSENCRLLKLGRVRVKLSPSPLTAGAPFEQQLRLRDGEMTVRFGEGDEATQLRVWVDAHRPVVRIEADCAQASELEATLEVWRTEPREIKDKEAHSAYGLHGGPEPIVCHPDTVLPAQANRIAWYHRNEQSIWADNLRHQGMEALIEKLDDPLLNRTFGGWIEGEGLRSDGDRTLRSDGPRERFVVNIHALTAQTPTADAWLAALEQQVAAAGRIPNATYSTLPRGGLDAVAAGEGSENASLSVDLPSPLVPRDPPGGRVMSKVSDIERVPLEAARAAHRDWWRQFWNRSWIFVDGPPEAEAVTRGYVLQRWINACAGRGAYPIKFNGTIFTVDMAGFDPDYRQWGGPYWWQNTRLPYWPMLASGDFDLMLPLFDMYEAALPLAEHRTQVWFEHGGAFFPETMYFWGMFTNTNYGWNRANLPVGEVTNRFIRREYTSSPELMAMMVDYYAFTGDEAFLTKRLLPMADSLLRFWDEHYERDENGRLVMYPAQALETLQNAKNPTPDVAGLEWVLGKLLELPEQAAGAERRASWTRLRQSLPPLPMAGEEGEQRVVGAEQVFGGRGNSENPELYAVFPFRLFGVGKPGLDIGRRTFERRAVKGNSGWRQDDTQAAFLGLTDVAAGYVAGRARSKHGGSRFPAFWGPNFDWIPDQDHGGNLLMALQTMLLQTEGDRILLLPAWPANWNVRFKLHAPRQTTVEGVYRDGKLEQLNVVPATRRNDVQLMLEGAGP